MAPPSILRSRCFLVSLAVRRFPLLLVWVLFQLLRFPTRVSFTSVSLLLAKEDCVPPGTHVLE